MADKRTGERLEFLRQRPELWKGKVLTEKVREDICEVMKQGGLYAKATVYYFTQIEGLVWQLRLEAAEAAKQRASAVKRIVLTATAIEKGDGRWSARVDGFNFSRDAEAMIVARHKTTAIKNACRIFASHWSTRMSCVDLAFIETGLWFASFAPTCPVK
jgi:hypothetical protein